MNEEIIKRAEDILSNRALKEQGYCVLALIDFEGYPTAATISPSKIVLTDIETKKEMWYEGMGYYFKGPEDPNFCVLRFKTQRYSLMLNEHDVNGSARGTL
jgi:hypothetical protein